MDMPLRLKRYITKRQPPPSKSSLKKNPVPLGFIIVRCIQDERTSKYWHHAYQCIRKFYPQIPIVIIDDNSDRRFINRILEKMLVNCQIIHSEYPCCGEVLGYYYLFKHHWFERAVILHDSVFIQDPVPLGGFKNVKFLWHFETRDYDDVGLEMELLKKIGGPYLHLYKDHDYWKGCFGVMSMIEYDFLLRISSIFAVLEDVKSRRHRCCMERIFAVMCFHHHPGLMDDPSILGDIHQYAIPFGYSFAQYQEERRRQNSVLPPLVKVWTGR